VTTATSDARASSGQGPFNPLRDPPRDVFPLPAISLEVTEISLGVFGIVPQGVPGAAPAVRYIQIALANPTIEVIAAARRSSPCDVVGRHLMPGGDPPDHSCQARRPAASAHDDRCSSLSRSSEVASMGSASPT